MSLLSVSEHCDKDVQELFWPLLNSKDSFTRHMPGREDSDAFCYSVEKKGEGYSIRTSYYVGVDWLTDELPIQVRPKVEQETVYIDYLKMLTDALMEPENARHLDGLLTVDFKAKPVPLEEKEDMLSPFIVAQFIMTLKSAVRSGLRQSYYRVTENLKAKVKGRIIVGSNIRENLSRGNIIDNICDYQEYGVNSEENRLLKRALKVSSHMLSSYKGGLDISTLKRTIAHIYPYFRNVGDDFDLSSVKHVKENPIYKDYYKALEYGILILKRYSYGFNRDSKTIDSTPPYWIDMSKLFELYVYRELRKVYKGPGEIHYHPHFHWRELDYLLNPEDGIPMVIDAKYKPRYHTSEPEIDDIRQISAYARMKGVYDSLHIEDDRLIDCLIIYASQECDDKIPARLNKLSLRPVTGYSKFYKWGIKLPVRK